MQIATFKYQIATYSGTITVHCNENDENETIYARARNTLERQCGGCVLPYGYECFKIINREDC